MFAGIKKKRDYHYHKVLLLPVTISRLWQPVAAYCMGPLPVTTLGNGYIVVIGDLFTKFFELVKRGEEVTHRFPFYQKCRVPFFEDDSKEDKGLFIAFCSVCENGTTRDVKIFLWSSFVTKKMCSMEMLKM